MQWYILVLLAGSREGIFTTEYVRILINTVIDVIILYNTSGTKHMQYLIPTVITCTLVRTLALTRMCIEGILCDLQFFSAYVLQVAK
jgi:hypothetical protein